MSKENLEKFKKSCERASLLKEKEVSKEKELQDELDKYWGQMDRVEKMLKWLVVKIMARDMERDEHSGEGREEIFNKMLTLSKKLPDISDILDDVEKK